MHALDARGATGVSVACRSCRSNVEPRTISMHRQDESQSIVMPAPICEWKKGAAPPRWNGQAAGRIVEHLEGLCHYLKQLLINAGHQRLVLCDDLRLGKDVHLS